MKVLIGIVSKNRAAILPLAIQSALDQDYPDKEIAVFDDVSDDNTADLQQRFPTVNWYFSKEPKGYLYARNKFMRETDADFYCSLDDDSWFLEKDGLTKGVTYLTQNTGAAGIAYDILSPDKPEKKEKKAPYPVSTFIGCGHLLRLSMVRAIGYYTPNPGFYGGEEKDLSIRLQDSGHPIIYLPGVHIWHDKTMVARDLIRQHRSGVCNDLVFALRRIPFPLIAVVFPGKVYNHFRFAMRHKLMKTFFLALYDFVKIVPIAVGSRKAVKKSTYLHFQRQAKSIDP